MAAASFDYETLVTRNEGYIPRELQDKLRHLRVLIAGCGLGVTTVEMAVRMGIGHLILADGDTVSATNLNRQLFVAEDIGRSKVTSIARRARAINPHVDILECDFKLDKSNMRELVAKADLVFDTIDFLDLGAIVGLHDECRAQRKPVITALAIGFGAGVVYFPAGGACSFRRMFGLPETGSVDDIPYTVAFGRVMEKLAPHLDPAVVKAVAKALTVMEDGTPCPASQVAPGAFAVAALAGAAIVRVLAGLPVRPAPELLVADLATVLTSPGINLLG